MQLHRTSVLGTFLAHRELGSGDPIVLLHGNPTSSHVWRNVMPALARHGRVLAPDLVGMGASGKPDLAYSYAEHARHLDAWFDALALARVAVVGYDWGGVLAIDWARRHEARVRGVALFETFLRGQRWSDWTPEGRALFEALRTPGVGERMVLEENAFLARSLAHGVRSGLADADRAAYGAPYPDAASRRPLLAWPRQIPIEGEPPEILAVVDANAAWLERSRTAKLLLTFDGTGLSNAPAIVAWARALPAFDVVHLGAAGHHAPEDAPGPIAEGIATWLASVSD